MQPPQSSSSQWSYPQQPQPTGYDPPSSPYPQYPAHPPSYPMPPSQAPIPPYPGQPPSYPPYSPPPYAPPQPPTSPYSRGVLWLFIGSYAIFWLLSFAGSNIGVDLCLGLIVSVLILDVRGFVALQGAIGWSRASGGKKFLIALLCFFLSPFWLGVYLVRTLLAYRRLPVIRSARKPTAALVIGSMAALFGIFLSLASAASPSSTVQTTSNSTASLAPLQLTATPTLKSQAATQPTVMPTSRPTLHPTQAVQPTPHQQVAAPTPKPTPRPAAPTPVPTQPPAARPTSPPVTGVNGNPWGYDFNQGNIITNPPQTFCNYFACINNFWNGVGYVNECQDGMYSLSGGIRGDCSHHGGMLRPLYSH